MSYQITKDEIIVSGWENGIAQSPHKGIANIQAGNISTEGQEIMANFNRIQQTTTNSTATGTITASPSGISSSLSITAGIWITTGGSSTIANISALTDYYVLSNSGSLITLASTFNGTQITTGTTGTTTFTIKANIGKQITKATEVYSDGTKQLYRYYTLDNQGLVWVLDTYNGVWSLPYPTSINDTVTGMAIYNGWLMVFGRNSVYCKPTVALSANWSTTGLSGIANFLPINNIAPHFAFVGHQGKLYYTDGNYIGSVFANTSLLTSGPNIQSYCQWSQPGGTATTGTISILIGGAFPTFGNASLTGRIPVVFLTQGTLPTAIKDSGGSNAGKGKIFYIQYLGASNNFEVYTTLTGGSPLDLSTGLVGTQYFNTFYPIASVTAVQTLTWTTQRLNLPFFETAQFMGEVGNTVVIGTNNNTLYPWNQVDVLPNDIIPLPESNVVNMITVNNMLYVFAGNKGNIYVTNGSTASLVLTVPDYCAGIAGTPQSYVEPYFTWGDAMYCRGRVYFSIQDQVSAVGGTFQAKAGNCGGIWSFVPSQNFYYGQDTGLSLRIENQNSYGTYNGMATILIPSQTQTSRGVQYWSAWQSTNTGSSYGIDFTGTALSTACVIETDLIPTGTMLNKKTFSQIEYKLAAPLTASESISISFRQNSTDAWTSLGTPKVDSSGLSGYFVPTTTSGVSFEKGQWLQLQITLNPGSVAITSPVSFVRLRQIIIR